MKRTAFLFLAMLAISGTAEARRRHFGNGGSGYTSNGVFGAGLELGEPTGLNGKVFLAPASALDFGLGALYNYYDPNAFHLYVDYLYHPFAITEQPAFKLPFYFGVGGRAAFGDCGGGNCDVFGIRIPIGIAFDFNDVPLDVFIQVVPTIDFFHDYGNHDVFFDVDFSVGIRYWFI